MPAVLAAPYRAAFPKRDPQAERSGAIRGSFVPVCVLFFPCNSVSAITGSFFLKATLHHSPSSEIEANSVWKWYDFIGFNTNRSLVQLYSSPVSAPPPHHPTTTSSALQLVEMAWKWEISYPVKRNTEINFIAACKPALVALLAVYLNAWFFLFFRSAMSRTQLIMSKSCMFGA